MQLCTIVARNYLAQARVLARSLERSDPQAVLSVLVVDGAPERDGAPANMRFRDPSELGLGPDLAVMRLIYDVTELSTALKPAFLRLLLSERGAPVTYLDPDIEVFTSLRDVERLAGEHGLVLTPHVLSPLPDDGLQPSTVDVLLSGTYNLGFVAVSDRPDVERLLDWWHSMLRRDCIIDHAKGWFVDQRFMDLAPGFVESHHILRDPAYNVAYWNLSERPLVRDNGSVTVLGNPLRFFHFSGFHPSRPERISKHQSRYSFSDLPVVAELYSAYAEQLVAEGFLELSQSPYGFGALPDGRPLGRMLRRHLRAAILADRLPDDVDAFTTDGCETVDAWITRPHGSGPLAAVPELIVATARERSDVMALFGNDPAGMLDWARRYGVLEYPIFSLVLNGVAATRTVIGAPGEPDPGTPETEGDPPTADEHRLERHEMADTPLVERRFGVNVVGFLKAELGIGEAARNTLRALDHAGVPALPVEGGWAPDSRLAAPIDVARASEAQHPVNLICVNPDVLEHWYARTDPRLFADRYNIGYWWWELQHVPPEFVNSLELVDEIWCGSRFVADAFAAVTDKPVHVVRVPVETLRPPHLTRGDLGLPDGFVFMFMFDFNSSLQRKNPLGLIDAFTATFAPGDGAALVIKSINAHQHPEAAGRLRSAASRHPHVHQVDRYVSASERTAMVRSADCYVSLHRSEGLGLTMAEAMALGTPVVATGWSGNLEFMTDQNSYLVPYQLVPVGDDGGAYPAAGEWAAPDLEAAGRIMREVFENPEDAAARAEQAARDVTERHSVEAAAESIEVRLGELRQTVGRPDVEAPGARLEQARAEAADGRGGGSPLRRLALRAMRPYTHHQDRVTGELVDAQMRTASELADLRRELATLRGDLLRAIRRVEGDERPSGDATG